MPRVAVVLMNLGGPDSPEAVAPFLYNLFSDPAIIRLPAMVRLPLARLIAWRRAKKAREIYAQLGGSSPLLANTEAQAQALERALGPGFRCFIAMRYWHPMTQAAVRDVREWRPDQIVCLPLYPQFSTTTTASSLRAWHAAADRQHLEVPTRAVCCYPVADGFVAALASLIEHTLDEPSPVSRPLRLLLTAHGLPQRIVAAGDPYPRQVERTAAAVVAALGRADLDWRVCYQSRVGPLEWTGPATDDEIRRAGADGVDLVVAPISFVSEHSETLVELDLDYRRLATECGVAAYRRVPTVGADGRFITALASLVHRSLAGEPCERCLACANLVGCVG